MCDKDYADYAERIPSEELLEAFAEVEEMEKHPERYKSYTSVEEMMRNILSEDDDTSD